jgi:hypothetical protein
MERAMRLALDRIAPATGGMPGDETREDVGDGLHLGIGGDLRVAIHRGSW